VSINFVDQANAANHYTMLPPTTTLHPFNWIKIQYALKGD